MYRTSLGVQEFDEKVQTAINRVQPISMIESTLSLLREQGIKGVNFDTRSTASHIKRPKHSKTRWSRRQDFGPDRVALFGYAHVPWMAKNQKMIPEEALPTPQMRYRQAEVAGDALAGQGYVKIGLDHFARPGDTMAVALREGRLPPELPGLHRRRGRRRRRVRSKRDLGPAGRLRAEYRGDRGLYPRGEFWRPSDRQRRRLPWRR